MKSLRRGRVVESAALMANMINTVTVQNLLDNENNNEKSIKIKFTIADA